MHVCNKFYTSYLNCDLQSGLSTGQTQYVLADHSNFKTTLNGGGHLIACAQPADGLGQEVEMVQYVDSTGQELSPV